MTRLCGFSILSVSFYLFHLSNRFDWRRCAGGSKTSGRKIWNNCNWGTLAAGVIRECLVGWSSYCKQWLDAPCNWKGEEAPKGKFSVNLSGEYNIGGDGWEQERILKKIGYEVVSVFTGDGSYETIKNSHLADLNLVMCHRSINYIAEMMKTKYGVDWIKVNFIGVGATSKSLRMMAKYFNDPELTMRTEEVIAEELAEINEDMEYYIRSGKSRPFAKTTQFGDWRFSVRCSCAIFFARRAMLMS